MRRRKAFPAMFAGSAMVFLFLVFLAADFRAYISKPADPMGKQVLVNVPKGEGFGLAARSLERAGLIRRPFLFRVYARLSGSDVRIKFGRYALSPAESPEEILEALVSGKGRLNRLTVVEGWTVRDIARAAEAGGFAKASSILFLASDEAFIRSLGIKAPSLEGYLFPDTYFFPFTLSKDSGADKHAQAGAAQEDKAARDLLSTMVRRFREKFTDSLRERARSLGLSVHQVVILASIIEKETGNASEYPIIASVFYNRLKARMRLQSDPTVIYGMDDYKGVLTKEDLHRDHPFNTYTRGGLPAGPISNPGAGAMKGVLYPASTGYYYFVSRKNGTHQFSETLEEHNKAVALYQL